MSNIPSSRRSKTKIDFYKQVTDLRYKTLNYLTDDFLDNNGKFVNTYKNSWVINKTVNRIFDYGADIVKNIIAANTIYITNLYEYNKRRGYMTDAISNCEQIIQEIQFLSKIFTMKLEKYISLTKEFEKLEDSIKNWRKSDNTTLKKVLEKTGESKS